MPLAIVNLVLLDFSVPKTTRHLLITMFCHICTQSLWPHVSPWDMCLTVGVQRWVENIPFCSMAPSLGRSRNVNKYLITNAVTHDPLFPLLSMCSLVSIISYFWTCPGLVLKVEDFNVCAAITQSPTLTSLPFEVLFYTVLTLMCFTFVVCWPLFAAWLRKALPSRMISWYLGKKEHTDLCVDK